MAEHRGTVVVTGVGRARSIGAAIARGLAADGWDLVLNHWAPYDDRVGLEHGAADPEDIAAECRRRGVRVELVQCDLSTTEAPETLIEAASTRGDLRGLVISHCESVDSAILDTTVESWDRHFAVNARAVWLLIKAFAERLPAGAAAPPPARIVALTSDHTAHNLPYGASKGALDRIVLAAALELGPRGVQANVINPGPIDNGWMTPDIRQACLDRTPAGRLGRPDDTAQLVRFLLSDAGAWVNGQLLHSDGGFSAR